jgi:hypothetical protein
MLTLGILAVALLGQTRSETMFAAGDKAYVMLPPEVLCAGSALGVAWSSSGKNALVYRQDVTGGAAVLKASMREEPAELTIKHSLVVWNAAQLRAAQVWEAASESFVRNRPSAEVRLEALGWIHGTEVALALTSKIADPEAQSTYSLLRIDAGTRTCKVLREFRAQPVQSSIQLDFAPTSGYAVLRSLSFELGAQPEFGGEIAKVLPNGTISQPFALPVTKSYMGLGWGADGSVYLSGTTSAGDKFFGVNFSTGKLAPLPARPPGYQAPRPSLQLTTAPVTAALGAAKATTTGLWIGAPEGKAEELGLVTPDHGAGMFASQAGAFEQAAVAPTGNWVLYVSNGVALARELVAIDKAAMEAARDAARKTSALSDAKQAGLALLMYAMDHGERLPQPNEVPGALDPYLKNSTIAGRFVYTFGGGPLSDIKDPAATELGYVSGPGGRAIVYADGHAVWKDD